MKKSELKVQYKPYSADDARSLVQNRIGSRLKAENELGFLFKYSLREGIEKLIDWRIVTGVDKKIL
jgi:UDP-glucose 4-epimerase